MTGKPLSFDAMQAKASEAAEFMRLFSTPSRLMLLCHIAGKERSVGEIQEALDFKQPALSQQLAELRQAGVVQTRRASRQIYYSIADARVESVMTMLMQVFCATEPDPLAPAQTARPAAGDQAVKAPGYPGEMVHWARLEDG